MLNTGPGDEWIQKNGAKYGFIYNGYKLVVSKYDFDPTKVTVVNRMVEEVRTPPPEPLTKVELAEPEPQGTI